MIGRPQLRHNYVIMESTNHHSRFRHYSPLSLILTVWLFIAVLVTATTSSSTKSVVILWDGVDLTTGQCPDSDTTNQDNVFISLVDVLAAWFKPVSKDDVDFLPLSSTCGDTQTLAIKLTNAISSTKIIGVLSMTSSITGDAIVDMLRPLGVPLVQMAKGSDVTRKSSNENHFVVSHYWQNQITIALGTMDRLNWTAFSVDLPADKRLSLLPLQEAAIKRGLCVLPEIHVTTSTPKVVIHPYNQKDEPEVSCHDTVLYLGPNIETVVGPNNKDCGSNRTFLAVEVYDEKWSRFCSALLQSNNAEIAPNSVTMNHVEFLSYLCSSDVTTNNSSAFDEIMNGGNILAAFSFILKKIGNLKVNTRDCQRNVSSAFACSLLVDPLYDLDVPTKRLTGKRVKTSYTLFKISDERSTQRQIMLPDAPPNLKNKDCDKMCHLCYKCHTSNKNPGNISLSRDSDADLYVVGLFPLHTSSSGEECDVSNPLGQAQALAFLVAVSMATTHSDSPKALNGVRGAVLDSCSSSLKTSSLIYSIEACESSWSFVTDENEKKTTTLQPNAILSYFNVDSHRMDVKAVKENQHIISVTKSGFSSFGDTSMIFVQQLVNVLLRLEWTTLNVVVSSNAPIQTMNRRLRNLPASFEFCFVNEIVLPSSNDGEKDQDYKDVVQAMLEASEKATVFLLLTSEEDTFILFREIRESDFGQKLQFVFTPWNAFLQDSFVVQLLTDENVILEPFVESKDLDDIASMRNSWHLSRFKLPGGLEASLDFKAVSNWGQKDMAMVTSSVRKFFDVMAKDDKAMTEFDLSGLKVESVALSVVAEDVKRRVKRTIGKIDGYYQPLGFFTLLNHSQCQGWCPECHTCKSKSDQSVPTSFYKRGDVIITGLFPLHKEGSQAFQCGRIQDSADYLLNVFAFMFAFETFHQRYPYTQANINVGGFVLDSCSSSLTAARTISDFETCRLNFVAGINASHSQDDKHQDYAQRYAMTRSSQTPSPYRNLAYVIRDDVLDADVFRSVLSGSDEFGDMVFVTDELLESRYIARALVKTVTKLGWSHAFLLSEDTPYFQSIAQDVITLSTYSDLCIVFQMNFGASAEWRVETAMDGYENFPVILISRKTSAYSLFDWFGNLAGSYFWILSATTADWDDYDPNSIPFGSLVLKSPQTENQDFTAWKKRPLDVSTAPAWLKSFWEYRYSCRFQDGGGIPGKNGNPMDSSTSSCSAHALKDDENPAMTMAPVTSHIIRTVDAIIHRVHEQHSDACTAGQKGVCPQLLDQVLGKKMSARDVGFSYQGERVELDSDGLAFVTLTVFNQKLTGSVKVGSYFKSALNLSTESVSLYYPNGSAYYVTGVDCRHRCSCIISVNGSQMTSEMLPSYRYRKHKGEFLGDLWTIVVSAIAGTGALTSLMLIFYVIYKVCKRAIAKRHVWLGLFLLISLILLYSSILPFILSASDVICGLRFLLHGVAFGFVFAGILVKLMTIQSYKIIGLGGEISNANQFITIFFIVAVQVAISVQWWEYNAPMISSKVDAFDVEKYTCQFDRENFAYFHSYLAVLLILCTIYSAAVRKEKKNMGEAKLLMACCIICLMLWTAWGICLFLLDREHSDLITCTAILSCATTIMLVIFVPKIRMVAGLKYSVSNKDPMKNGYSVDPDFLYERPFTLPGTLTSTFSGTKINPPKPLSHFNSDVNY